MGRILNNVFGCLLFEVINRFHPFFRKNRGRDHSLGQVQQGCMFYDHYHPVACLVGTDISESVGVVVAQTHRFCHGAPQ